MRQSTTMFRKRYEKDIVIGINYQWDLQIREGNREKGESTNEMRANALPS